MPDRPSIPPVTLDIHDMVVVPAQVFTVPTGTNETEEASDGEDSQ